MAHSIDSLVVATPLIGQLAATVSEALPAGRLKPRNTDVTKDVRAVS